MKKPSSFLKPGRTFEMGVWFFAAMLASIRLLIFIISDLINDRYEPVNLVVSATMCAILAFIAYLILSRKVQRIHPVILILLIILNAINFLQYGGITGSTDYNLFGLGVIVVLATDSKYMKYVLATYFLVVIAVLSDGYLGGPLSELFYLETRSGIEDFYFTSATIVILVAYFKYALVRENQRLLTIKEHLKEHTGLLLERKELLKKQNEELKISTKKTNKKFVDQTKILVNQHEAIADFAMDTNESIRQPLVDLTKEVKSLDEHDQLKKVIIDSVLELDQVTANLRDELQEHD